MFKKMLLLLTVVLLSVNGSALAIDHWWHGGVSDNLNDPANWTDRNASTDPTTPTGPSRTDIVRIGGSWDSEDLNENGILDPGEDLNGNGLIDDPDPNSGVGYGGYYGDGGGIDLAVDPVLRDTYVSRDGLNSIGWLFMLNAPNILTLEDGAFLIISRQDSNIRNGGRIEVQGRSDTDGPSLIVPKSFRIAENGSTTEAAHETSQLRINGTGWVQMDPALRGSGAAFMIGTGDEPGTMPRGEIIIEDQGRLELLPAESQPYLDFGNADPNVNQIIIRNHGELILPGDPAVMGVVGPNNVVTSLQDMIAMGLITSGPGGGELIVSGVNPTVVTAPPTAAMIVSNVDLSAGFDQAQYDRLVAMGYDVTVATGQDVKDDVFTIADAETFDVLVVSESIGSGDVNKLIGANVPMMHEESYGWSRHFFTTGLKKTWVYEITTIDVVADHEILTDAGLSAGPLDFFTAPTNATSDLVASLVPGAVNLAQVTVDANDFTLVFAIEAGTELADTSLAANRIVGFSLPGTAGAIDASVMTDEAWAFFDAAIRWLDPAPIVLPPMVAHWTMDEGAGTLVADVVGGNDGEMVGLDPLVAWIADGALDGAVSFDGIDGHNIAVPDSNELDFGDEDFTISMMVRYPSIPTTEHRLISKGTFASPGTGSRYDLYIKGSELRFEIDNGPANTKSSLKVDNAPLVTGEWVHVVAIRDAVNDLLAVYADDILLGTAAETSGDISNGEGMRIGASTNDDSTMTGDIDDLRIFNAALTEDEIAAIGSLY